MRTIPRRIAVWTALFLCWLGPVAQAQEPEPVWTQGLSALKDTPVGSFYLPFRLRYEYADQDGLERSTSLTLRSRLGFASRTWEGLSVLAELESVVNLGHRQRRFETAEAPNGRLAVGNPDDIDFNQLYVSYEAPFLDTTVRVGRQRMQLDDMRFIGSKPWQQNEMTMDAVRVTTSLGVPDLRLLYAFIDKVNRPFGNQGPAIREDFDSHSHVAHLQFSRFPLARLSLFFYELRLDHGDPPGTAAPVAARRQSSRTYGFRLTGDRELSSGRSVGYALSHAHQVDAWRNPVDYKASYQSVDLHWRDPGLGRVSLGFERLGDGENGAVLTTPFAAAHGPNGFADVFVDNGARLGLRDYFVEWAPKLPARLTGHARFHRFHADSDGDMLGWEVDGILSRPLNRWLTAHVKAAYFHGQTAARPTRYRAWVYLTAFF